MAPTTEQHGRFLPAPQHAAPRCKRFGCRKSLTVSALAIGLVFAAVPAANAANAAIAGSPSGVLSQNEEIAEAKRTKLLTATNVLKITPTMTISELEKLLGPQSVFDSFENLMWYNWVAGDKFLNVELDSDLGTISNIHFIVEGASAGLDAKIEKVVQKWSTFKVKDATFQDVIQLIGTKPNEITFSENTWVLGWAVQDIDGIEVWGDYGIWAQFSQTGKKLKLQTLTYLDEANEKEVTLGLASSRAKS
jgi:hypothetical protein